MKRSSVIFFEFILQENFHAMLMHLIARITLPHAYLFLGYVMVMRTVVMAAMKIKSCVVSL